MAGAISPRVLRALIALGAAAVLALWWHSTLAVSSRSDFGTDPLSAAGNAPSREMSPIPPTVPSRSSS